MKKVKMSHAAWYEVIQEHVAVGGSVAEFCRERGLKDHSYYWHKRRMHRESEASGFREVPLRSGTSIRVIIPGSPGHVEVTPGFDGACLRDVVHALA